METFITSGVCSKSITFDVDSDGAVHRVSFEGGCNGNGKGIAKLAEGRPAAVVADLLSGIRCGENATSCPDQLARALRRYMQRKAE